MQTQEVMVNEGIAMDAGLNSEASIDDNTSTKQQNESSSLGHATDAERARVDKVVSDVKNDVVRPSFDNDTLPEKTMLIRENRVLALRYPFILNKAKELTPSLYYIDKMGKDLRSDHKIISEEELKCEAEKCLKVKQRKSPLSYHGFVYGDTQFVEPPKVHLKRREVDLKKQLEQAQLGKPPLQPLKNQSVVRQPNAFKSERPKFSKQLFASQVDVNNDLPKPVTPYYWPKLREHTFAKPHHMIASSETRNNSQNMPRFSSNDMVHNHYLEEAKKKTQERDKNSKTRVMPSARLQNTANGSKPKPRSTNQMTKNWPTHKSRYVTKTAMPKAEHRRNSSSFSDSKRFVCSTCQKCVFNENHNACITNLLKEVNSWDPYRTNVLPKQVFAVYVKTTPPKSGLTWKPTGRIFTYVGLMWIPMGKTVGTCLNTNDSAIPLGKETCSPKSVICANSSSLSASTSTASEPNSLKGSSDVNILSSSSLYKHSIFNYV
ncbi:hypothetical protein Tco_0912304 [Tanacetum coccineum]